ncbi:MAG TPA: hypothetical protein PKY82_29180 [Pyrinomonadaceae bacterium]|nr:hypothetical protein [Pyrinomonadaceae bacterium]
MLHEFVLAGQKVKLWQRPGESYQHILMKALGYAMFVKQYPNLEIEIKVDLRYKPDLVVFNENREFEFWGECGQNSIRKTVWLLKHTRTEKLVLFKIGQNTDSLIKQLQTEIEEKYRPPGRVQLINFVKEIADLTATKQIEKVSRDWYRETEI